MTSPLEQPYERALRRLREGNRRFAAGKAKRFGEEELELRQELASGQAPDAVVLTCADSRVPPSLIFDHGLGDLFVVRVAGNVVTPEVLGSVEFAVESLRTPLVLVLGHTGCGAVTATVDLLGRTDPGISSNLRSITERIRPVAEKAVLEVVHERNRAEGTGERDDPTGKQAAAALGEVDLSEDERADVLGRAVRLNVEAAVDDLRTGSSLLERLAEAGELTIVGGEYSLESGRVELFG